MMIQHCQPFFLVILLLVIIYGNKSQFAWFFFFTMRHRNTRKEAQKRLQDTENLFRKNLQLKDVC